ncbi:MAG: ribonuclease PH, partial [Myxococcales bacterium]|nr:ribonuclease PH [Myxococcales bacterium]
SITGAWVAVALALAEGKTLRALPPQIAAVSLGVHNGQVLTDLCYEEDRDADVDLNFVTTAAGIVEVQGTAEGAVYSAETLMEMVSKGQAAAAQLFNLQREAVLAAGVMP